MTHFQSYGSGCGCGRQDGREKKKAGTDEIRTREVSHHGLDRA
jgi:hypothetical protein